MQGVGSALGHSQEKGELEVPSLRGGKHPGGGSGSSSPIPVSPRAATGSRLPHPEYQLSPGPLPTPIRGVAPGQAGQVACSPGAGPGPDNVNEDQPGSAKSSR